MGWKQKTLAILLAASFGMAGATADWCEAAAQTAGPSPATAQTEDSPATAVPQAEGTSTATASQMGDASAGMPAQTEDSSGAAAAQMEEWSRLPQPQISDSYWGGLIKVSSARERRWGQEALEKCKKKYKSVEVAQERSPLKMMEDRFVACNSDVLNYNDGKHKRWLAPVYLITDDSYKWGGEYLDGGFIVINRTSTRHMTPYGYNFVMVSSDAVTMAHELTHHIHEDGIRIGFQRSRTHELQADDGAMNLLANVPEYSMGSMFYDDRVEDHNHYSNAAKKKMAQRVIHETSGGRVTLDDAGRLYLDGKLVFGSGKMNWTSDASAEERTAYLAGQIATTMQKGCWHYRNLGPMRESEYLPGRNASPNRTLLVACAQQGNREGYGKVIKVLGSFDYPLGRADKDLTYAQQRAKAELEAVWDLAR